MNATLSAPTDSTTNVNGSAPSTTPQADTTPAPAKAPRKAKAPAPAQETAKLSLIQQLRLAAGATVPSVKPSTQFDRVTSFAKAVGLPCASLLAFRDRILSLAAVTSKCRDSANGSRASVSLNIVDAIGRVKLASGDVKAQKEVIADLKRQWNQASRILAALECEADGTIVLS